MTLWIVEEHMECDGFNILGVFDSEEKAIEAVLNKGYIPASPEGEYQYIPPEGATIFEGFKDGVLISSYLLDEVMED